MDGREGIGATGLLWLEDMSNSELIVGADSGVGVGWSSFRMADFFLGSLSIPQFEVQCVDNFDYTYRLR